MKAEELMIGDWVMLDKSYPPTSKKPTQLTLTDMIFIARKKGEECEPIPLTAEILEKNGFVKHHNTWGRGEATIDDITYSIDGDVRIKGCLLPIAITTVHELQHAIRLCGLNELADNFKVI